MALIFPTLLPCYWFGKGLFTQVYKCVPATYMYAAEGT